MVWLLWIILFIRLIHLALIRVFYWCNIRRKSCANCNMRNKLASKAIKESEKNTCCKDNFTTGIFNVIMDRLQFN